MELGKTGDIAGVLGMRVEKLCELTGYSRQAIFNYCRGINKPTPRRWNAAINALQIEVTNRYQTDIDNAAAGLERRLTLLDAMKKMGAEQANG